MNVAGTATRIGRKIREKRDSEGEGNPTSGLFLVVTPAEPGVATSIAERVAESVYGDAKASLRFDLSDFEEKHTIGRFLGFTGGLVCAWREGELTGPIARRPGQLVLFESVEKAHADFFRLMMAILAGPPMYEVIDAMGRDVSFQKTVILMTIGASARAESSIPRELMEHFDDVIVR